MTQDLNQAYIKSSEDILGIFWTCYVRSVVVLYQGGHIYSNFGDLDNLPLLPSSKCLHLRLFLVFLVLFFIFVLNFTPEHFNASFRSIK